MLVEVRLRRKISKRMAYVCSWWIRRVTLDVGGEVPLPSDHLHRKHPKERVDWGLFKDLTVVSKVGRVFCWERIIGPSFREVILVTLEGAGGLVMSLVGRSPSVVGNQQGLW